MSHCISQKVSWLTLEQYRLGDISDAARAGVEAHLNECGACSFDLAIIDGDTRMLKPLPVQVEKPSLWDALSRRPVWITSLALATSAALLVLVFGILKDRVQPSERPSHMTFKGGDLALSIVRERDGVTSSSPTHFTIDDRFMLYSTHPLPDAVNWEVVVFQGKEASFPYVHHPLLEGGNRVPLPGAFRLTEELPALICLMVGDDLPSQTALEQGGVASLPEACVCIQLEPVGSD